ncbi:MAG: hypothetical protein ACREQX_14015 [Candidatus Binataceae bacterium]
MMKTVWLTALEKTEQPVQMVAARLARYGLKVDGHLWTDDLANFAWIAARDEVVRARAAIWLILTGEGGLQSDSVRYGLSLFALALRAQAEISPATVLISSGARTISAVELPTPLAGAAIITTDTPSWEAKLVALANLRPAAAVAEYRLDAYGDQRIGQWFELGPRDESWNGALFGVAGGAINLHAAGGRGKIPDRTVLNFPQMGLRLTMGAKEFCAWAVRNQLGPNDSYFVRVEGSPDAILFGPYAEADAAELFVHRLK